MSHVGCSSRRGETDTRGTARSRAQRRRKDLGRTRGGLCSSESADDLRGGHPMQPSTLPTRGRSWLTGTIGALIGAVLGLLAGAYLGMVVGGTFLGSVEIAGLVGYELGLAVGACFGVLTGAVAGVVIAIWRLAAGRGDDV